MPRATAGSRRSISSPRGRPGRCRLHDGRGHARSASARQDQEVLGPDFQAGNFGLDMLGIPGTNDPGDRRPALCRIPALPDHAASVRVGNRDGWNPIYPRRAHLLVRDEHDEGQGQSRVPQRVHVNFLYLDHWQPETGNPRGRFQFATNTTAPARRLTGEAISTTSTRRSCSGWSARPARACRTS